jgi:hypothetical protein
MVFSGNFGVVLAAYSRSWDCPPPVECDDTPSFAWLFVILLLMALGTAGYYLKLSWDEVKELKNKPVPPPPPSPVKKQALEIIDREKDAATNYQQDAVAAALQRVRDKVDALK